MSDKRAAAFHGLDPLQQPTLELIDTVRKAEQKRLAAVTDEFVGNAEKVLLYRERVSKLWAIALAGLLLAFTLRILSSLLDVGWLIGVSAGCTAFVWGILVSLFIARTREHNRNRASTERFKDLVAEYNEGARG